MFAAAARALTAWAGSIADILARARERGPRSGGSAPVGTDTIGHLTLGARRTRAHRVADDALHARHDALPRIGARLFEAACDQLRARRFDRVAHRGDERLWRTRDRDDGGEVVHHVRDGRGHDRLS